MQLIVRALVNRFERDGADWAILAVGGFEVSWPRDLLPPDVKPTDIVDITVRRDDDANRKHRTTRVYIRVVDGE